MYPALKARTRYTCEYNYIRKSLPDFIHSGVRITAANAISKSGLPGRTKDNGMNSNTDLACAGLTAVSMLSIRKHKQL